MINNIFSNKSNIPVGSNNLPNVWFIISYIIKLPDYIYFRVFPSDEPGISWLRPKPALKFVICAKLLVNR